MNHIQVPKLGVLRTFENLPQVKPKSVTISRSSDRWFISFRIEAEPTNIPKTKGVIGVDLGVKSLAVLSNGEVFQLPASIAQIEEKISRLQWLNRNKQVGSANWEKAQARLGFALVSSNLSTQRYVAQAYNLLGEELQSSCYRGFARVGNASQP